MRIADDGALLLSPSDLAAHLACAHLTQLSAAVLRGELPKPPPRENAHADLIARKGDEHEAAYLARLEAEGKSIVRLPTYDDEDFDAVEARRLTEEAIRAREADVIYQAYLTDGVWRGFADFLVKVEDDEGRVSYEPVDTKLARRAKPAAVLQLTFYSHELARIQGRLPERMRVVLGTGLEEEFRPGEFAAFYRRARVRLEEAIAQRPETYPYPVDHCGLCTFFPVCDARWDAEDHLVRVASIRRDQIERLDLAGISTLEALGDTPAGTAVPHMSAATFETLRHQASLQLAARRTGTHSYELLAPEERRGLGLLPAPSPGDLFYDIEGDPFWEPGRGLEYLHGITDTDGRFTAIWAHDRDEERVALERVIGLFHERLAAHPDMHVYHYAAYETTALKRLVAEHGILEEELDQLLRRETFVDLFTVTRQALRISYPSYSIKKVREFFMEATEELGGGDDAIVAYERWVAERDQEILDGIERYNEEDCLSNLLLRGWLLERREEAEARFGVAIPWRPEPETKEPDEEATEFAAARAELRRSLQETGDEAHALMGDLLEYHRREARPVWWWFFARTKMTPEQLVEDSESIGCLEPDGSEPEKVAKSLVHGFRFPVQQQKLDVGDTVFDPVTMGRAGEIVEIDAVAGTLRLSRGPRLEDVPLPTGLIPGGAWKTIDQQKALMRLGASLRAGDGRYAHLEKLLRREPPLGGARVQCEGLEAMGRLVREVEGSYLFVQGPPGSGKTWTGRAAHHGPDQSREARRNRLAEPQGDPQAPLGDRGGRARDRRRAPRAEEGLGREPRLVLRGRGAGRERRERRRLRRRRPRPLRGHRLAPHARGARREARLPLRRRGRPDLARGRARARDVREDDRAPRRPGAAGAGHAGRAPGRRGPLRAQAPPRRPSDRGRGHGTLPRALVPDAPRCLRVHLRRVLRGAPPFGRRVRAAGELVRHRDPLASGVAPGELDLVGGGGDGNPGRDRAAAHGDVDGLKRGRAADHSGRRHGRRAVQRAGEASPGAAPGWRRGRHRGQVPGPAGAGRLLLDGVLVGRRRSARNRLPHVAEPPERRGLARAVPRLPRLCARSPRRGREDDRAHAACERALPLRRARCMNLALV